MDVCTLDLILVGFGRVGRALVRLLDERAAVLRTRHDLAWRIIGVATLNHGTVFDPAGLSGSTLLERYGRGLLLDAAERAPLTVRELLERARVRVPRGHTPVMVETTPLDVHHGGEPATGHVRAALEAGLHVVTANKGPVAFAYRELRALAARVGRRFLFEGAVMDGIPVFSFVRETLPAVEIRGFRAILNTTTQYILCAMERGESFERALQCMQEQGFTEADPSHDLEGWDAAAKTAALVNVLLDGSATPLTIAREGIRGVGPMHLAEAVARGCRLRMVASAAREWGAPVGRVRLEELAADDPLAGLKDTQNAIMFDTDLLGRVGVMQLESGLVQTAYALVADLVACAKGAPNQAHA